MDYPSFEWLKSELRIDDHDRICHRRYSKVYSGASPSDRGGSIVLKEPGRPPREVKKFVILAAFAAGRWPTKEEDVNFIDRNKQNMLTSNLWILPKEAARANQPAFWLPHEKFPYFPGHSLMSFLRSYNVIRGHRPKTFEAQSLKRINIPVRYRDMDWYEYGSARRAGR